MEVLSPPGERTLYTLRFPLMGGEASVQFVDDRGEAHATWLGALAKAEARRVEAKYSRYRDDSVTTRVNRAAGLAPVPVDAETEQLVEEALSLARLTEGRFDPTVGVLRHAWDFRNGVAPTEAQVAALLPLVDHRALQVGGGLVHLKRPGMELDLGGVGKEYVADRVAELLWAEGVSSALVNFLGDVRTLGRRGDGQPWVIGVQDPRDRRRLRLAIRASASCGVATSGDYERCFEVEGVRHHHLLDATTGWPAQGLASVTVVAPTASEAGRLATACFLLGPTRGLDLLENTPSVEGALITPGGELQLTSGMGRIATVATRS